MFKKLLLAGCILLQLSPSYAQESRFYNDNDDYFKDRLQINPGIASGYGALILFEKATIEIRLRIGHGYFLQRTVHRTIQILNKDGYDFADVRINGHISDRLPAQIRKVHATTYNMAGGILKKQSLDNSTINKSNTKDQLQARFSLPDVKEGTIIDYSYEVDEDLVSTFFADWNFQAKIPKLYSELEVYFPSQFQVSSMNSGNILIAVKKIPDALYDSTISLGIILDPTSTTDVNHHLRFIRTNIDALHEEVYMAGVENYLQKLRLKLSAVDLGPFEVNLAWATWEKINRWLVESDKFYNLLRKDYRDINEKVRELTNPGDPALTKARRLFNFVRGYMTNTGDRYSKIIFDDGLSESYKNHAGSPGEINMILINMLRHADLEVNPVLISTDDYVRADSLFPLLDGFNRVVAELIIDSNTYYLDASEPNQPFGVLPRCCYNGFAWVVSNKNGHGIELWPRQILDKELIMLNTTDPSPDHYKVSVSRSYNVSAAIPYRLRWRTDTALIRQDIIKELSAVAPNVSIGDMSIENLNDPDQTLKLNYTITLRLDKNDMIYLNPSLISLVYSNPFTASTREYPIEMPAAIDRNVIAHLTTPDGYKPETLPKSSIIQIDENNVYNYVSNYDETSRQLNLSIKMKMLRTNFTLEEYDLLQQYYEKIVELQQQVAVLKKA